MIQSRSESSWESNRSDVILQANSPTWRKARYSVDSQHTHTHIRMTHTQTECVRFRFLNMSYDSYVHATSEVRSFLRNVACST